MNQKFLHLPIVLVGSNKAPIQVNWPDHVVTQTDLDAHPNRGFGIKLGPRTGFVDIEGDGPDADAAWKTYFADAPPTVSWTSPRGTHRLFRFLPGQFNEVSTKIGDLEIRCADRTQSVLPPMGGRQWVGDSEARLLAGDVPFLPVEVTDALPRRPVRPVRATDDWDPSEVIPRETLPGAAYGASGDWSELLTQAGWRRVGSSGEKEFWKRPGETTQPHSATVGHCRDDDGNPALYVFSTNAAPFEAGGTYSLFQARALLLHDGDYAACARELRGLGFGAKVKVVEPVELCGDEEFNEFPTLDSAAFENLIGEYALDYAEYFPVDPAAVLFQGLDMFGALIGKQRFYRYRTRVRYIHDFLMVVGDSGNGKGDAFDAAKALFVPDDSRETSANVRRMSELYMMINLGRFGSGEGMGVAIQERNSPLFTVDFGGRQEVLPEQYLGCIFCTEHEASGLITKMLTEGSTLVDHFLKVWDSNALSNRTKTGAYLAKSPVVTFIGHLVPAVFDNVPADLLYKGLVNRFRFVCVPKPPLLLDDATYPTEQMDLFRELVASRVMRVVGSGKQEVAFSEGAKDVIRDAKVFQHGLAGGLAAANQRFVAHLERTAVKLALLGGRDTVSQADAEQARGMQDFVFACTRSLLGRHEKWGSVDRKLAEKILGRLRNKGLVSRTELCRLDTRKRAADYDVVLQHLISGGSVAAVTSVSDGKTLTNYRIITDQG